MSNVMSLLAQWLPQQRWFAGDQTPQQLELVGSYELPAPDDDTSVRLITVALVRDAARPETPTYQVPMVIRDVDAHLDTRGYIGAATEHGDRAALVDGAHDPAFARAIIALIGDEGQIIGADAPGAPGVDVYGQPMPGARVAEFASSRILQGEQSNTSIICELQHENGDPAVPLIVKVFRAIHPGDNPDVTLQTALAASGSLRVPPTFGQVTGVWQDPERGQVSGHFVFAQEFFSGVQDAWRVALRCAESGEDFGELARLLGEATAEVHATLARVMPTVDASSDEIETAVAQMHRRFDLAVEAVPELEAMRDDVTEVYAHAGTVQWPRMQRIHGDYHLGQVLAVPDRGWVLLDFEGEPLRSLDERNLPDLPQRDLAGMLRSFDYVSGALSVRAGREVGREWADAARDAFLAGYLSNLAAQDVVEAVGRDDLAALLRAYELDKAVYETLYEAQHRPEWLPIPVMAVQRLSAPDAAHAAASVERSR
ncbi:maltokinase N-terminal cap-like domain-containing protein [Gulosibacter bifidus]|uniref:Maltokinase n=1 Tax=Gulosibacter bifidus TaxID=272239 RepID=A0ABW5RKY9_9MICO|nr:hypothetical protein [Gulosibacter bifidus]